MDSKGVPTTSRVSHARVDTTNSIILRHPPTKPAIARNHIYLSSKSTVRQESERIRDLLMEMSTVTIHGLGRAIGIAMSTAIQVEKLLPNCLNKKIRTSTVKIRDDIFPLSDEAEMGEINRPLSAIHITLYRE